MPDIADRRTNWAPWLAFLFVLAVIGVNLVIFLGMPGAGLVPWLSLVFAVCAALFGVTGVWRAFLQSHLYGGKISSCLFGALALLMFGVVVFGQFHARDLPVSAGAPRVGQKAPDFALSDTNGNKISLEQLLGAPQNTGAAGTTTASNQAPKAVLLIFYRGYW